MALFFYGFAILMIFGSLMVIRGSNPVHCVLWLIFTFCNGAGLMVLMGAEFLAMMLVIIYVGAVAVLFLFVVMMLDINFSEFKAKTGKNRSFAFIMALFLFADLIVIILLGSKTIEPVGISNFTISPEISNAHAIGGVLYTDFILSFQMVGLILFVAMVASIALTLRVRSGVKRQKVANQLQRNKSNSLEFAMLDGKSGLGNLDYDR